MMSEIVGNNVLILLKQGYSLMVSSLSIKDTYLRNEVNVPTPHGAVFTGGMLRDSGALSIHSPYEEAVNRRRNGRDARYCRTRFA
jgi:hypothetical protein